MATRLRRSGSGAMLTSEEVREIERRVAADYACLDAPGFRDSLAARRDVAALLADRAEMQAGIERLQGVNQTYRILVEELREENERLREALRAIACAYPETSACATRPVLMPTAPQTAEGEA